MEFTRADQDRLIEIVRDAARDQILPRFRNLAAGHVREKTSPADLVTEADIAAEEQITRSVEAEFPGAVVIGEEAVSADARVLDRLPDAELAVIVDPIDGTWNFAKGLAVFGVIVAVTLRGQTVFGALYDPVADDWVVASGDEGARLVSGANGAAEQCASVAPARSLEQLAGHVPLFMFPEGKQAAMTERFRKFGRVQSLGCSCHEYRLIALGRTDFCLTISPQKPWDHAAGVLICQQAGGYSAMLDGQPYDATKHGHILTATDRTTWERLREEFGFLLD